MAIPDSPPVGTAARPAVLVWRESVVALSESFIPNQVAAMTRWRPVLVGMQRHPESTAPDAARILYPSTPTGRLRAERLRLTRRSRALREVLAAEEPRVVHAHFGPDATVVLAEARSAGVPLVVTFHGYDATSFLRPGYRSGAGTSLTRDHYFRYRARLYQRRVSELFAYSSAVIAVSHFVAAQLRAVGVPETKLHVHYMGIPMPAPVAPRQRAGVLFVGRLVEKKGVGDLLTVLSLLRHRYHECPTTTIVGDGPLRAQLEQQACSLGLDVHFAGALTPAQIRPYLRTSRVFCGLSRTSITGDAEGLGLVFLEAAAHSLPILAYRHGGVVEAVRDGHTGLLVDEGDIPGAAAALARLIEDDALVERLGAAGRAMVETQFDVTRQTPRLEALYDRVVAL